MKKGLVKHKVIISGSEISNIKISSKSHNLNKILFISSGLEKDIFIRRIL